MNFYTDAGDELLRQIAKKHGPPCYVYSESGLKESARQLLAFPNAYGLTVRYAMKACPTRAILRTFSREGIWIDASSEYEISRAIKAGIPPGHIQLTAQQLPRKPKHLAQKGVRLNACSLRQLEVLGQEIPGQEISVRMNPGLGSGHSSRTNTGGPSASFGIWHEYIPQAKEIARRLNVKITRLHTHIGSGSDPDVWVNVASMSLKVAKQFEDVTVLNLGGGFKIGRMPDEKTTNLQICGRAVKEEFEKFAKETGRKLHLEIEPGTYLVAPNCLLLAQVIDVVDTGKSGYRFIKTDTGMTENLRPSLYGAQHPLRLVALTPRDTSETENYVAVGHCCESGDILTPGPGNPESISTRNLPVAEIGDLVVAGFTGAYCAGMNAKNYNSFPEAPEVMVLEDGSIELIRKRQTLEQMTANEL